MSLDVLNAPDTSMSPRRRVLAATHPSVTHAFAIGGREGWLTIGLHEDGRPGAVLIRMSGEGSTLSGLLVGFSAALGLALQCGLPLADAIDRFRGMRFEPSGPTSNEAIPHAASILDYAARYLEMTFVQ